MDLEGREEGVCCCVEGCGLGEGSEEEGGCGVGAGVEAGRWAEGCGCEAGVGYVEGGVEADAVGDDADDVVWLGGRVGEEVCVYGVDYATAVLEEEDVRQRGETGGEGPEGVGGVNGLCTDDEVVDWVQDRGCAGGAWVGEPLVILEDLDVETGVLDSFAFARLEGNRAPVLDVGVG